MTVLESYIEDLKPLVNIDCGTSNYAGVTKVAEMMKKHYDSIGFHTELIDFGPNAGKGLFATNKPDAEKFDCLLNGHLDTVFPDGTAAERPFSIKGDRAYGPGCSDCKSGVLAMFYAIKNARKEDLDRLAIAVVLNPDEETCSPNSNEYLTAVASKSKRALVFEAARAGGELVRSRKGSAVYQVEFHGAASHAGNAPYVGANANVAAMRFCLAACGLSDVQHGTTVSPGTICGGTVVNVISDYCKVTLDVRFWNPEDEQAIRGGIEKLLEAQWAPRVTQTWKMTGHIPAMPFSDATRELVGQITQAAKLEGFDIKWVDAGGASDGNHMAQCGTPVIDGCGPAGAEFHNPREYLRLDTVEERIRMISRFFTLI